VHVGVAHGGTSSFGAAHVLAYCGERCAHPRFVVLHEPDIKNKK
jgi:hypothetical protein